MQIQRGTRTSKHAHTTHPPVGVSACSALIGQHHTNRDVLLAEPSLQLEHRGAEGAEMKVLVCVCIYVYVNLITVESPHLSVFLYCVSVCVFPRRQVRSRGGVQTHTEQKQFDRLVIQTGVCSQTCRATFVLQLCFVKKSFLYLRPLPPPCVFLSLLFSS